MSQNRSSTPAPTGVLDAEPDEFRRATCPMCQTQASVTQGSIETGGDWRCVRCGQHWDAERLASVAAYAVWVASQPQREDPNGGHAPAAVPSPPSEGRSVTP